MRQNTNQRRGRGRSSQSRRPGRNQSFDSNGPGIRLRGTAAQLHEKYQALARDATSAGDRVMAENCHQHADHYYRVMLSLNPPAPRDEDRQPEAGDYGEMQPHDGRGRADRSPAQAGPNRERREGAGRRGRDDGGEQPPVASPDETADRSAGSDAEPRSRGRRQPVRRQDSDPRRRAGARTDDGPEAGAGGRAGEARPGDEPLDRGLHRILGGPDRSAPERAADEDAARDSGDEPEAAGPDSANGQAPESEAGPAAAEPAEAAPKPRTRRRKPAAGPDETPPDAPLADAAV